MAKYNAFDLKFYSGSVSGVLMQVSEWIKKDAHEYICVSGAHGVVESQRNSLVFQAHKAAGLVVPDGMSLVWTGRIMGFRNTERIYGPDLFLALCEKAEKEKWNIFLFGTTPETLTKLARQLTGRYPSLRIVGCLAPPFRPVHPNEDTKYIEVINRSKAHIVFVGLSTPKQEIWMRDHHSTLRANVLLGVGAAFDFIAGTKKQAPVWVQRSGFEWLFRFFQEPRRLWYRTIVGNSRFVLLVMRRMRMRWLMRALGTMVLQGVLYVLMAVLMLFCAEVVARIGTSMGWISYYHPIIIQPLIDPSAQKEDWRLTHMYKNEQFVPDASLFWKPRPGVWRYNEDGFVGNIDISVLHEAKERGGCSVLAIGDSNTQGITGFSWPESLNELFVTNGLSTRVANAGVAGYSSFQGEYLYNQLAESLQPTVVIVSFGWNDMAPDMGMPDRNFSRFSLPANSVLSRSMLYLVIQNIFSPKVHNDGEYHPRVNPSEYRENLNAIITTAQQHKSSVLLLTRPYNPEHMVWNSVSPLLKGGWRKYVYDYNNVVRSVAEERQVQLIDLEKRFASADYFLDDSHFTQSASRLTAIDVFELLQQISACK